VNGRPDWFAWAGTRKAWRLPRSFCKGAPRCLVKARFAQEVPDGIPIDQIEVTTKARAPALMLTSGRFVLDVQDAMGKTLQTLNIRQR
jgi:hypothetical protein